MLKSKYLRLTVGLVGILFILISLKFVLGAAECWQYDERNGGNKSSCNSAGCLWTSNDSSETVGQDIDLYDEFCDLGGHCCLPNGCWQYNGNESVCENTALNGGINCTWDPYASFTKEDGSNVTGLCFDDFQEGMDWGGMEEGCWNYDGDKTTCTNSENIQKCSWVANNVNQNPWCKIKTLLDAQTVNSFATEEDIGCCDMIGCWSYDGNEEGCVNSTLLKGLCTWSANDPGCQNPDGCCYAKWCGEIGDEINCTKLAQQMFMPCEWNATENICQEIGGSGGGFAFFNDTDTCLDKGGWWNGSNCEMPEGDGSGDFMFADNAHCWFADNQKDICNNITGCVYCDDSVSEINNASSACYNNPVGFCQGHEPQRSNWNGSEYVPVIDISTDNLNCTHIKIKSACEYGPLPNCIWSNSSTIIGDYCSPGTSSIQKAQPPVPFCDHPDAKNNYTLCMDLAQKYLMPCKWGNASSNKTTEDNCTFNSGAVFGTSGGEKEFEVITSETSCVAAGGTWMTEYYIEESMLKQDSWCEKGAMFDFSTGQASANKGNCDSDCWACDFNTAGGNYENNATQAELACINSALGYCVWTADPNAANGLGWCDYPKEMDYGSGDCQSNCKDCDLMQNPYDSCISSVAGCKWVNDTNINGDKIGQGKCVDENKKICDSDCFSCYDFGSCKGSLTDCYWDETEMLCKPNNFDGEICFNGKDDDGDGFTDCSDPDCGYDMACGGANIADCPKYTDPTNCENALAFDGMNCTWINMSWENFGHCGMPGEDCWSYDNNMTECGLHPGCTNESQIGNNFCDINATKQINANCQQYDGNQAGCDGDPNCQWVQTPWGDSFCDYYVFVQCSQHGQNRTACQADNNCIWNSEGDDTNQGFCDIACFNDSLDQTGCENIAGGICSWKDASEICMPTTFEMFGESMGSKSGCNINDGNQTACNQENTTCMWSSDINANNNVSDSEPSGWCESKGDYEMNKDIEGDVIILCENNPEQEIPDYLDIIGYGLKVTKDSYGFGVKMSNVSGDALCNGYPLRIETGLGVGTGEYPTRISIFLDTNGNKTDHCSATDENGVSHQGFEFYVYNKVVNNSGITTTKKLYKCAENGTGYQWVLTNIFVSDNKKFTCMDSEAIFVSIEKETLENFQEFNITSPMRLFAISENETDVIDSIGPSGEEGCNYYTPGTIDFNFVDCSNPDTKNPKCKNYQKFGFQLFEECKNGIDDDSDGYTDCEDMKCVFTPACSGSAFNFSGITNDYKAPIVVYSNVDKMADAAMVLFDTDEPANGTLIFYNQSSSCTLGLGNKTLYDVGDVLFTYDDYKPFHRITLDSNSLGYNLINSTTYYYKVIVCDTFANCGTSACLNFTTKNQNKNFIFRMNLPEGFSVDIPALNLSNENFTRVINGKTYEIGFKTNATVMRNINITVKYRDLRLKFVGVDLYKPKTLELENAFVVDSENNVLGMNSSSKSWYMLLSDLGLGGIGDFIELEFPIAYSPSNILKWSDESLNNESDVTNYTDCSGNTTETSCKIPTSMGFSVYKIETPESESSSSSSSSGSGSSSSSSGGGAITTTNPETAKDAETPQKTTNQKQEKDKTQTTTKETTKKSPEIPNPKIVKSQILKKMFIAFGIVSLLMIIGITFFENSKKKNPKKRKKIYKEK